MPKITIEETIHSSPEALFGITQDYTKRLTWDPFLKIAELINNKVPGEGVKAWCVDKNGIGMETEYVSFKYPHVAAVKMTLGPKILEKFSATWRFESIDSQRTRVVFHYYFKLRPLIVRWLFSFFVFLLLQKEMRQRLTALKTFVERQNSVI